MIALLSPAKNLDFESAISSRNSTVPEFVKEANLIAGIIRKMSIPELSRLLQTNQKLTMLNAGRFAAWQEAAAPEFCRPAVLAYHGEVYHGLDAQTFNEHELNFSQEHLIILSGLYGLLKPMDLIQPYRLEMQAPLQVENASNLYQFWKEKLTRKIQLILNQHPDRVIINLVSK